MGAELRGRHVVLGVGGGIAAYKSPDVVRRLREAGAEVRVAMTPAGQRFITALTLQAVSGHPVLYDPFAGTSPDGMDHIALARWADAVLVAPATADLIARLRAGLADDLLTSLYLAGGAPWLLAPAMNEQMWRSPATQDNVACLRARGVQFVGPAEGEQACGDVGPGRMVEPAQLVHAVAGLWRGGPLAGRRVLITAGPTREPVDPVRYLSNRSSGRMGMALAAAARDAGAEVTVVCGPVAVAPPAGVEVVPVTTADEMAGAVMGAVDSSDVFIGAAAVADYRPLAPEGEKIKRAGRDRLVLELGPTPDILAAVCARDPRPFVVGFAAETTNVLEHARVKLVDRGADMIVANDVSRVDIGFDADDNEVHVVEPGGVVHLPRAGKHAIARALIELIAARVGSQQGETVHG